MLTFTGYIPKSLASLFQGNRTLLNITSCIEFLQICCGVCGNFVDCLVLCQSDFSQSMNNIEPEKPICIDHIFIPFPKGITRVLSFSNNLRKRVNEGL